jgi:uncharacterized membrane protein YfbV (UPF0208 family)
MTVLATIWEPLGVAIAIVTLLLTGIVGGVRWLGDRARRDSEKREERFDEVTDTLVDHGERLAGIEGHLGLRSTTARRRANLR